MNTLPEPKDSKPNTLLLIWLERFWKSEKAHYRSATFCRVFNYALGIPLVVITAITATKYFTSLETNCLSKFDQVQSSVSLSPNYPFPDLVGFDYAIIIITISAPIIAALQTFLRFPERAEQHKKAAIKFGQLKREVEKIIAFPPKEDDIKKTIEKIQEEDSRVMDSSPSVGTISLFFEKMIRSMLKPLKKRFGYKQSKF